MHRRSQCTNFSQNLGNPLGTLCSRACRSLQHPKLIAKKTCFPILKICACLKYLKRRNRQLFHLLVYPGSHSQSVGHRTKDFRVGTHCLHQFKQPRPGKPYLRFPSWDSVFRVLTDSMAYFLLRRLYMHAAPVLSFSTSCQNPLASHRVIQRSMGFKRRLSRSGQKPCWIITILACLDLAVITRRMW